MSGALLAVDLGLRVGLARFRHDGCLHWYRSTNFGSRARLKLGVESVLREAGPLHTLVLEGGGDLALPWTSACRRTGIHVLQVSAEDWRRDLLLRREQRSGLDAKKHADTLARQIIEWSDTRRPTSLRHDAAEAICLGFWAVLEIGWLAENPLE